MKIGETWYWKKVPKQIYIPVKITEIDSEKDIIYFEIMELKGINSFPRKLFLQYFTKQEPTLKINFTIKY
jgi:hypothetical protein